MLRVPLIVAVAMDHHFVTQVVVIVVAINMTHLQFALLSDREWQVYAVAAIAMGKLGDPRAVAPLIAALSDADAHWRVHQAAGKALSQLRDTHAAVPLIALLSHGNAEIRCVAARTLGSLGDTGVLSSLRALLADAVPRVAQWAREAIAQLEKAR